MLCGTLLCIIMTQQIKSSNTKTPCPRSGAGFLFATNNFGTKFEYVDWLTKWRFKMINVVLNALERFFTKRRRKKHGRFAKFLKRDINHPNPDTQLQFAVAPDTMSPMKLEQIRTHIQECERCSEAYERMTKKKGGLRKIWDR